MATSSLRRLIDRKARDVTKNNVVRQECFSAQLEDLMNRYMRQQLTGAAVVVAVAGL
ncbi:type I restriction enzyme endonuclease domain-containing protein [Micromonospora sp. RTP1Z1]|uniref:type I restriction enzyme endonuclease domain-containing protein n=1 Tax=Micromonospora sp. RTP1Z1 TaxID=2994043 RepID=UPI0029C77978|nr:type I restriction enzyme endonuclease domain-containing protein [Micromonospora sp. RTP1Z1]